MTSYELPQAGPDETLVLEAPLESLTEKTRRLALLAQVVAEERLPSPGPPRDLKVRFQVPYSRSVREIYEGITERAVVPFVAGKAWQGFYDPGKPKEVWVDAGPHAGELIRNTLHELVHAWRARTPEGRTMTQEAMEQEASDWAERLLPAVLEASQEEGAMSSW